MTRATRSGSAARGRLGLFGAALLLASAGIAGEDRAGPGPQSARQRSEPKRLFICTGDQARRSPDFLAVVNFDAHSADYGKVIARAPLPEPGATGNEMHHIGLSADGRIVACGGLLSVLKGQKEIFFWNISDPTRPQFISSANPPRSSITDEFHALPEGASS